MKQFIKIVVLLMMASCTKEENTQIPTYTKPYTIPPEIIGKWKADNLNYIITITNEDIYNANNTPLYSYVKGYNVINDNDKRTFRIKSDKTEDGGLRREYFELWWQGDVLSIASNIKDFVVLTKYDRIK